MNVHSQREAYIKPEVFWLLELRETHKAYCTRDPRR